MGSGRVHFQTSFIKLKKKKNTEKCKTPLSSCQRCPFFLESWWIHQLVTTELRLLWFLWHHRPQNRRDICSPWSIYVLAPWPQWQGCQQFSTCAASCLLGIDAEVQAQPHFSPDNFHLPSEVHSVTVARSVWSPPKTSCSLICTISSEYYLMLSLLYQVPSEDTQYPLP